MSTTDQRTAKIARISVCPPVLRGAWSRKAMHPDRGEITLDDLLDIYSAHGANHVKQITDLRARKGW